MKDPKYCAVEIAFGSKEMAEDFAKRALDARLIASCQIIESESIWNWKREREGGKESLAFVKTRLNLCDEIFTLAQAIHDYETFEFAIYPLTTINLGYESWLEHELLA